MLLVRLDSICMFIWCIISELCSGLMYWLLWWLVGISLLVVVVRLGVWCFSSDSGISMFCVFMLVWCLVLVWYLVFVFVSVCLLILVCIMVSSEMCFFSLGSVLLLLLIMVLVLWCLVLFRNCWCCFCCFRLVIVVLIVLKVVDFLVVSWWFLCCVVFISVWVLVIFVVCVLCRVFRVMWFFGDWWFWIIIYLYGFSCVNNCVVRI